MKLKDFLQNLLNAPDLTIKINGKELNYTKHIQDLTNCPNADSEIIMWEVHHNIIEIWVVENES